MGYGWRCIFSDKGTGAACWVQMEEAKCSQMLYHSPWLLTCFTWFLCREDLCKMALSNILFLLSVFVNDFKQIRAHSHYRVLHRGHDTEGMTGLSLCLPHRFLRKQGEKEQERMLGASLSLLAYVLIATRQKRANQFKVIQNNQTLPGNCKCILGGRRSTSLKEQTLVPEQLFGQGSNMLLLVQTGL